MGAVAGVAVLAGTACAVARRRRQRSAAAAPAQDALLESGKGSMLPYTDRGSSSSSQLGCKPSSADGSLPPPSPGGSGSESLPLAGPGSPRPTEGPLLAELLERVASVEAAAASNLGASQAPPEHVLLSAESLPPRLRECLVAPSAVSYCRWPNGQPLEIGAGATSRVYRAVLNGELLMGLLGLLRAWGNVRFCSCISQQGSRAASYLPFHAVPKPSGTPLSHSLPPCSVLRNADGAGQRKLTGPCLIKALPVA